MVSTLGKMYGIVTLLTFPETQPFYRQATCFLQWLPALFGYHLGATKVH